MGQALKVGGSGGMNSTDRAKLDYLYQMAVDGNIIARNLYNKEYLTESDMLTILNNNMFYRVFVGCEVELINAQGTSNRWIISDMNHDNTTNTFDLTSKFTVKSNVTFGSSQLYNNSSSPRVWLNGDFYNGFSTNIKNHMKTMAVAWNGTTLNDKVKLLSVTEVGYSHQYAVAGEGNRYYEYGPHIKNVVYWLRSRNAGGTSHVWFVNDSGHVGTGTYSNSYCLAPVIRLG